MALRTPLCDLLGIEIPILNVGFGWSATPELAAAVSNAGGLGVLGLGVPVDEARARIARTRELTSRPFGGNIIIATFESPHATEAQRAARRALVESALAERMAVLVLFWGDPAPFVVAARAAGTKLLVQVGSPEEVASAVRAGVDAVIVQGSEAGGHVKATRSIWDVLPQAVKVAGDTPLLASGGHRRRRRDRPRTHARRAGCLARDALRRDHRGVGAPALQGAPRRCDRERHGIHARPLRRRLA